MKPFDKKCLYLVHVCEDGFVLSMASKYAQWTGLNHHYWLVEKLSLCAWRTHDEAICEQITARK